MAEPSPIDRLCSIHDSGSIHPFLHGPLMHGPPMHDPDWNEPRWVLAVHEAGSLSAAARVLGVSQSTMSRRIAAVEAGGRAVFRADGRLTERGKKMVAAARQMARAFARAQGDPSPLRIASCEVTARLFVADALSAWSVGSGQAADHAVYEDLFALRPGDYDLLVSPFDSPPEGTAGERIGVLACALFAAPAYVEQSPVAGDLAGHRVILASGSLARVPAYAWLAAQGGRVALLSSSPLAMLEACARGQGVALLPQQLADDRLCRLDLAAPPDTPVWLVADAEDATHPRIASFLRWARAHFRKAGATA